MTRLAAKPRTNHQLKRKSKPPSTKAKKAHKPLTMPWIDTLLDYIGGFIVILLISSVIVSLAVIFRNIMLRF